MLSHYEANDGRPPHKLALKLRGPFRILNSTYRPQGTIYTCEKLATGKVEDFHVKLVVEYHLCILSQSVEAAIVDTQVFMVEAIRDHLFDGPLTQTNLKFLVHLQGTEETDNTWEPYTNVSKVAVIHQCLQQNNLKKFIPEIFRENDITKPLSKHGSAAQQQTTTHRTLPLLPKQNGGRQKKSYPHALETNFIQTPKK